MPSRSRLVSLWLALLLSVFPSVFAISANVISLPDLGEPTNATAKIGPTLNAYGTHFYGAGFTYTDNQHNQRLRLSPEYSQRTGLSLNGLFATRLNDDSALGVHLTAGADKQELLFNLGLNFSEQQRLMLSLGQLRQQLNFNFQSGISSATIKQNNSAFSYQYLLNKKEGTTDTAASSEPKASWLSSAELNGYLSDTRSRDLPDQTYAIETARLYELWNDPRRIAGGRITGLQGKLNLSPASRSLLSLGLGAERLTYDYFTGKSSTTRNTASAELRQQLSPSTQLSASANTASSQSRYGLGLNYAQNQQANLGLDLIVLRGRDNTQNDQQIRFSYTLRLGGAASRSSVRTKQNHADLSDRKINPLDPNHPSASRIDLSNLASISAASAQQLGALAVNAYRNMWPNSLLDQVSTRPNTLPSQVVAKLDNTTSQTRLIAIDKSALPAGSSVAASTGVLTVPLGVSVSAIAGITRNSGSGAVAFTNAGQFALAGTSHIQIDARLIAHPAVGITDTYVVTMNNSSGGGTTLATITVVHGSVHITGVVITPGQLAQTISFASLSAKTITDAAFNLSATASSGLTVSFTSNSSSVCTLSGNTVTLVAIGTCSITASQAGNADYSAATSVTQTFSVNGITPTLSGLALSASSVAYGATAPTITDPTSASAGAITYSSSNTAVASISGSTITIVGVGSTTINATQAANGNYASTTATTGLTVTAATPTLSGFVVRPYYSSYMETRSLPNDNNYWPEDGGSTDYFNLILYPSSPSSGEITYTSSNSNVVLVASDGVAISFLQPGTVQLTATQAASGNYRSSSVTIDFVVNDLGCVNYGTPDWSAGTHVCACSVYFVRNNTYCAEPVN